jgi:hypothetical protein
LLIRHPTSGEIVRDFVEVHEKTLHLFIVSRDLQHFEHAHPEHLPDGSFEIDATLPRPGSYQLYLDFMPLSGTPQLLQRSVVTTGFVDDPYATRAILQTDVAPRQDQGLRVTLQLPAGGGLIAGRQEMFRLHVDDMASGEPVTDLEPYLGATGHVLIVSDDLADAVHSHPVEEFSKRTGPDVVFEAVFPRSGLYKMWAQFQRRGKVAVVPFVIPVADPS